MPNIARAPAIIRTSTSTKDRWQSRGDTRTKKPCWSTTLFGRHFSRRRPLFLLHSSTEISCLLYLFSLFLLRGAMLFKRGRLPQIISKLPNLQRLALEAIDAASLLGGMRHRVILPALISLEMTWFSPQRINDALLFFGTFSLPSLQSLTLNDQYGREDYITLLQSLV
jgi:hypothetical protein